MKRLLYLFAVALAVLLWICSTSSYGDNFKFVVTSDTQGGDNGVDSFALRKIVQATIDEGADFILISGDLVEGSPNDVQFQSQLLHWRDIMQPLYDANIGVFPVRGNHDNYNKAVWDNVFSGDYSLPANGPAGEINITYSFSHKTAFVIGLDEYITAHRINQAWLDAQLASNTQVHIFVFGHEPAFRLLTDGLDAFPNERDSFWRSIQDAGTRIYFCGHDHHYDHTRLDDGDGQINNDVHQIITVGGDKFYYDAWYQGHNGPWVPLRIHHEDYHSGYVLVEIAAPRATLTWKYRSPAPYTFETGEVFTYVAAPYFPDPNLKDAVETELGISDPTFAGLLGLTELDANNKSVETLTGLEYAANLADLDLRNNQISDISAISKLTNLTSLLLDNNPLDCFAYCRFIPIILNNNPSIAISYDEPMPGWCDCNVVYFADANLKSAVETELGISEPNVTDMLALTSLDANTKWISDLTGLEYASNLTVLNLYDNLLNSISQVSGLSDLTELEMSENQIMDVSPLASLNGLSILRLQRNGISDISPIAQLSELTELNLPWNYLSEMSSLSQMDSLTYLELTYNTLNTAAYCTYIPLIESNNPGIWLSCDPNPNQLTSDCSTDWSELVVFAEHWLEGGCGPSNQRCGWADLDHVYDVSVADFAQFANLWLD
jgi:predicted phosphodiesterase